MEQSPHSRS